MRGELEVVNLGVPEAAAAEVRAVAEQLGLCTRIELRPVSASSGYFGVTALARGCYVVGLAPNRPPETVAHEVRHVWQHETGRLRMFLHREYDLPPEEALGDREPVRFFRWGSDPWERPGPDFLWWTWMSPWEVDARDFSERWARGELAGVAATGVAVPGVFF